MTTDEGRAVGPWSRQLALCQTLRSSSRRTTGCSLTERQTPSATITFTLLALAQFAQSDTVTRVGGGFGFATAALAWYASFAGFVNST